MYCPRGYLIVVLFLTIFVARVQDALILSHIELPYLSIIPTKYNLQYHINVLLRSKAKFPLTNGQKPEDTSRFSRERILADVTVKVKK